MAAIFLMTFQNIFFMKIYEFGKKSLKPVPKGPINNVPALVQILAWRRTGDNPLFEPMMVSLLMHMGHSTSMSQPSTIRKASLQASLQTLLLHEYMHTYMLTQLERGCNTSYRSMQHSQFGNIFVMALTAPHHIPWIWRFVLRCSGVDRWQWFARFIYRSIYSICVLLWNF